MTTEPTSRAVVYLSRSSLLKYECHSSIAERLRPVPAPARGAIQALAVLCHAVSRHVVCIALPRSISLDLSLDLARSRAQSRSISYV